MKPLNQLKKEAIKHCWQDTKYLPKDCLVVVTNRERGMFLVEIDKESHKWYANVAENFSFKRLDTPDNDIIKDLLTAISDLEKERDAAMGKVFTDWGIPPVDRDSVEYWKFKLEQLRGCYAGLFNQLNALKEKAQGDKTKLLATIEVMEKGLRDIEGHGISQSPAINMPEKDWAFRIVNNLQYIAKQTLTKAHNGGVDDR